MNLEESGSVGDLCGNLLKSLANTHITEATVFLLKFIHHSICACRVIGSLNDAQTRYLNFHNLDDAFYVAG